MAEGINAGDVVWKITGEDNALQKALKGSVGLVQKHSKLLIGVGAGITGALGLAAKSAVNFGTEMSRVNTLGVKDLGALSESVKDVSGRFGLDLSKSAQAAYQAISAGASEAEVPKILEAAAIAAAGGFEDLDVAVDLGMGTMNAFGGELKSVTEVFDLAAVTVNRGVTDFGQLSASIGKLSPLFAAAGLGADEMFASVAALTKGGIATAEAVTGMKGAISGIIKPSEAMAIAFEDVGGPMAVLEKSGLPGFMEELRKKTGGNVIEMGKMFSSQEALNALLALTGSAAQDFTDILGEMQSGTSASKEAFDRMVESDPAFAFRQLKSEMGVLVVDIGSALLPALKSIVDFVSPIVTGIVDWRKENKGLFDGIVVGTAIIGGLTLALGALGMAIAPLLSIAGFFGLGSAATAAAGVAGGATGIGGVATAGTALVAVLTGPVGVVAAVAAAGIAIGAIGFQAVKTTQAWLSYVETMDGLGIANNNLLAQMRELGVEISNTAFNQDVMNGNWKNLTAAITEAEIAQGREISALNGVMGAQEAAATTQKAYTSEIWGTIAATQGQDEATKTATATSIEWSGAVNRARTAQERDTDAATLAAESKSVFEQATKDANAAQVEGANVSGLSAEAFIGLIEKNEAARVASEEHTAQVREARKAQQGANTEIVQAQNNWEAYLGTREKFATNSAILQDMQQKEHDALDKSIGKVGESEEATEAHNEVTKKFSETIKGLDTTVKNLDQTWNLSVAQIGRVTQSYNDLARAAWNANQQIAQGGGGGGGPGRAPGMATGGMITAGGAVNVHKDETLLLPTGAEVLPRQHSPQGQSMMQGGGGGVSMGDMTINVNGAAAGLDVRALGDLVQDEIGESVFRAARRQGAMMGAF